MPMENEKVEMKLTLFGWKALVVILLVIAFIASYIVNLTGQEVDDKDLLEAVRFEIYTTNLREKLDNVDMKSLDRKGKEIAGMEVDIKSAEGACPFIKSFYDKTDMVVRATWTVSIDGEEEELQEGYFEVHYYEFSDSWHCHSQVGKLNYYINMIDDD